MTDDDLTFFAGWGLALVAVGLIVWSVICLFAGDSLATVHLFGMGFAAGLTSLFILTL